MSDLSGNFINPDYATPEQVKQLREYGDYLQRGAAQPNAKSWAGVLAQALMGYQGQRRVNQANELQQQALKIAAAQDPTVRMLQGYGTIPGGPPPPNVAAPPTASPSAAPGGMPAATPASLQQASAPPDGIPAAILQQESGNNPNIQTSINGAVGPGQIMPATFNAYAKPGEDINNPEHNRAVSARILADYSSRFGGDPARVATAYFSGPGNVAPPGSPTPWKRDVADGNGKHVSSYVSDISRRLMGQPAPQPSAAPAPMGAVAQMQPQPSPEAPAAAPAPIPAGGSPSPPPLQQMAQNGALDGYTAYQHNPWANPNEQALARGIITPAPTSDVYGRPGVSSVAGGVRPLPVAPNFQPGIMAPVTAGANGVTVPLPMTPPNAPGGAPNYGGGSIGAAVAPIAQVARDLNSRQTLQKAAVDPQAEAITQAQKEASEAPQILRQVNTIIDDLNTHGDAMAMGPTANWETEAKKVIANFAPGLLTPEQLKGMAANEAMDKASSTLGTLLGRQVGGLTGSTDASMFEGLKQIPGSHNSLMGAKALADMIKQGAILQQRLGETYRALPPEVKTDPNFDFIGFKNQFYQQNPIINPLTQHDILLDMRERGKDKPQPRPGEGWAIIR